MSLRAQRPSAIVIYTVFEKDTVSFSFSSSIQNDDADGSIILF